MKKYKLTALVSAIISLIFAAFMLFIALKATYTGDTEYRSLEGILRLIEEPSFVSTCTFFGGGLALLVVTFAFVVCDSYNILL